MSWTKILHNGQQYMQSWPMRRELTAVFPENRVIKATRFASQSMPALAVLTLMLPFSLSQTQLLPSAIAMALFMLSLPLQGYLWLGQRSESILPPGLKGWYTELHQKMRLQGLSVAPVRSRPQFKDLAQVLSKAFKHLEGFAANSSR